MDPSRYVYQWCSFGQERFDVDERLSDKSSALDSDQTGANHILRGDWLESRTTLLFR